MDAVEVIRRFYDAYNAHDLDAMASAYSEWGSFAAPGGLSMQGRRDAGEFDRRWIRAFPDLAITISHIKGTAHSVVVEGIARGTHLGSLRLLDREVPPSGHRVELRFCAVYTVDEGLIASAHLQYDRMQLLNQVEQRPARLGPI